MIEISEEKLHKVASILRNVIIDDSSHAKYWYRENKMVGQWIIMMDGEVDLLKMARAIINEKEI